MNRLAIVFLILLSSACSSLPPAIENAPNADVSYSQAVADINAYKGAPIRWGGVIVDLQNEQNQSILQVLAYPLNSYGRPEIDKPYQGRFLIKTPEFLDPAVYVKDREITAAGSLKGDVERIIGNKKLKLPVIESTVVYLWPQYDMNDYYGRYNYYPYYWGGYYGYSPFYWGGYYRGYPRW